MIEPLRSVESRVTLVTAPNVDTDQIYPASFLNGIHRAGQAEALFAQWREPAGGGTQARFDASAESGKAVMLVGENFGSGSSREHAVWALTDFGYRVLIGTTFGDIFRNNAFLGGLLLVQLPPDSWRDLRDRIGADLDMPVSIDLPQQEIRLAGRDPVTFEIDAFLKNCLLDGLDATAYALDQVAAIAEYEDKHPPALDTRDTFFLDDPARSEE